MRCSWKRYGRRKPYTPKGLARLPCIRCGAKASSTWCACADGNRHRPLCLECDVALNELVLGWMRFPKREAAWKIRAYRQLKILIRGAVRQS